MTGTLIEITASTVEASWWGVQRLAFKRTTRAKGGSPQGKFEEALFRAVICDYFSADRSSFAAETALPFGSNYKLLKKVASLGRMDWNGEQREPQGESSPDEKRSLSTLVTIRLESKSGFLYVSCCRPHAAAVRIARARWERD